MDKLPVRSMLPWSTTAIAEGEPCCQPGRAWHRHRQQTSFKNNSVINVCFAHAHVRFGFARNTFFPLLRFDSSGPFSGSQALHGYTQRDKLMKASKLICWMLEPTPNLIQTYRCAGEIYVDPPWVHQTMCATCPKERQL